MSKSKIIDYVRYTVYFALIVIPSVMMYKKQIIPVNQQIYLYKDMETYVGLYSYWKSVLLGAVGVMLLSQLAVLMVNWKKTRSSKVDLRNVKNYKMELGAAVLLVGLMIVSALTSEYQNVVWGGIVSRSEGTVQWITYLLLFISTILAIDSKDKINRSIDMILTLAFITLLHGSITYNYPEFYNMPIIKSILLPMNSNTPIELARVSMFTAGLYNPNYMGSFCALVIPLFTFYKMEILNGWRWNIVLAWMWYGLFASSSSAGFLGTIVSITFILFITKFKPIREDPKRFGVLIVSIVIMYVFIGQASGTSGVISQEISQISTVLQEDKLDSIDILEDRIVVDLSDKTLQIVYEGTKIYFYDELDKLIKYEYDNKTKQVSLDDARFEDLKLVSISSSVIAFDYGNIEFY